MQVDNLYIALHLRSLLDTDCNMMFWFQNQKIVPNLLWLLSVTQTIVTNICLMQNLSEQKKLAFNDKRIKILADFR